MYERTVEKSTFRETEVGDSFTMFEPFNIRPVLLGCARLHVGQCGKFHATVEHFREYLVEVGLLTTNDGAIRKGMRIARSFTSTLGTSANAARQSNSCGHFRGFLRLLPSRQR